MQKRELVAVVVTQGNRALHYCIGEKPPEWVRKKFETLEVFDARKIKEYLRGGLPIIDLKDMTPWEPVQSIYDTIDCSPRLGSDLNRIRITDMEGNLTDYTNATVARFYEKVEKK